MIHRVYRNTKLRCVVITFKPGMNLVITNLAKRADLQAHCTTKMLIEVITASVMFNALHSAVTSSLGLLENRIDGTRTHTIFCTWHKNYVPIDVRFRF